MNDIIEQSFGPNLIIMQFLRLYPSERYTKFHQVQAYIMYIQIRSDEIFQNVSLKNSFYSQIMSNHISCQSPLNNYRVKLIKYIINLFLKIRFNHESNLITESKKKCET